MVEGGTIEEDETKTRTKDKPKANSGKNDSIKKVEASHPSSGQLTVAETGQVYSERYHRRRDQLLLMKTSLARNFGSDEDG